MVDWNACLSRTEGVEVNEVDDGYVVYQPERDRVHYLNQTAVLLLELCDGRTRAGDLAALLKSAFALPEPPADEVAACLASLVDEGLLR